ncbi:hypothetical protein F3I30_23485 [Pantoea sp. Bo_34a]|uniref:Uncharacterized protein n=1 Tax=Candidatus Pantoea gossypiicola TaxID=2608008 RepID=A0AB34CCZ1_9GAMM|nr:hypothetical protein F3I36_23400 [Pantoea sp. FN_2b]KAA6079277.1 hypothetical protein F3I30_23485 [Pantoea sp. Bo_34a]KAA6119589.1 hypothetical protein F3I20_21085 [Pantoea gossypiicola]
MSLSLSIFSSSDTYVLLYSASQDCFHIEKVSAMVEKNILRYLESRKGDYLALAFSPNTEDLLKVSRQLAEKRGDAVAPRYLLKPAE